MPSKRIRKNAKLSRKKDILLGSSCQKVRFAQVVKEAILLRSNLLVFSCLVSMSSKSSFAGSRFASSPLQNSPNAYDGNKVWSLRTEAEVEEQKQQQDCQFTAEKVANLLPKKSQIHSRLVLTMLSQQR